MAVQLIVAVTDRGWFDYLRIRALRNCGERACAGDRQGARHQRAPGRQGWFRRA